MITQPGVTGGAMMPSAADEGYGLVHRPGQARADLATADGQVAVVVDHVADFYRRYPGESVTLLTRVRVQQDVPGFMLRVLIPAGLELEDYRTQQTVAHPVFRSVPMTEVGDLQLLPGADGSPFPLTVPGSGERSSTTVYANEMIWVVGEPQTAGTAYEFEMQALVLPTLRATHLISSARVLTDAGMPLASENVQIAVFPKGRYLEHLPALYEQDDFIGRFLMLFESFWGPIDLQIDSAPYYLDPALTPARFLPWLAEWFDLEFDDSWSEAQQRELLRNIMWLYRRRGTRVALQRYLEIYTQQPVEITERRAKNLTLGPTARLGVGVALGAGNVPHTFVVRVRVPKLTPSAELDAAGAAKELARLEGQRRARLERLIAADKPAHTSYLLEIIEIPADV